MNKYKNDLNINDIAYSFQKIVIDYTCEVVQKAIKQYNPRTLILSGGVSANKYLRESFSNLSNNVLIPLFEYSTDNGAMIARALIEELDL